jgi:serine/threonine protein kinase
MYCPNPYCQHRQNPEGVTTCHSCRTNLLVEGRYRLLRPLRPLEFSCQADVFEVTDGETHQILKLLKDTNPQAVWRFEREVLTLRLLEHPGIPKVEDYFSITPKGSPHSFPALVLEKMTGETLEQWRENQGAPSEAQVIAWLKQLTEILDLLHQKQLFHRDIKPANVIVQPNGEVALIDFGSVREISGTYLAKVKSGEITQVISAGYTPPEQIEGKAVPQSDFFALGRTFIFLLTGVSPVNLPTNPQTGRLEWRDACDQAHPISEALANFIDDLMAPLPLDRPQNTAKVLQELSQPRLQHRRMWSKLKLGAVVTGLALLGVSCLIYPLAAKSLKDEAVNLIRSIETNYDRLNLSEQELKVARQVHETAALLQANSGVLQSNLGLVCKKQKDYGCAIAHYQKALDLTTDPESLSTIYVNLGVLSEDIQDYEGAIAHYQKARNYNEENTLIATNNLARLYIWQRRDPQTAIRITQAALKSNPTTELQAALLKNLGWAYLQKQEYAKAETALSQSLSKRPSASALCLMAKTLQFTNPERALPYWQECLSINSHLPEVKVWQLDASQYASIP